MRSNLFRESQSITLKVLFIIAVLWRIAHLKAIVKEWWKNQFAFCNLQVDSSSKQKTGPWFLLEFMYARIHKCGLLVQNEVAISRRIHFLHPPRTHRTARFLFPCAGVDNCLPYMTLRTHPPDLAAASGSHVLRGEGAIERRMPACRHGRFQGRQIVKPCQNLPACTVGAI